MFNKEHKQNCHVLVVDILRKHNWEPYEFYGNWKPLKLKGVFWSQCTRLEMASKSFCLDHCFRITFLMSSEDKVARNYGVTKIHGAELEEKMKYFYYVLAPTNICCYFLYINFSPRKRLLNERRMTHWNRFLCFPFYYSAEWTAHREISLVVVN